MSEDNIKQGKTENEVEGMMQEALKAYLIHLNIASMSNMTAQKTRISIISRVYIQALQV